MKKIILMVICLLGVAYISTAANTTQDYTDPAAHDATHKIEKMAYIEKKQFDVVSGNVTKHDLLSRLNVFCHFVPIQKRSDGGIKFSVEIINESGYTVRISNPLDGIHISLKADAKQVDLPVVAPRGLVNNKRNINEINLPFKLNKVELDKKVLSPAEIEQTAFTIPSRGAFAFEIEIDQVLKHHIEDGDSGKVLTPEQLKELFATELPHANKYEIALRLYIQEPYVPNADKKELTLKVKNVVIEFKK